MNLIVVQITQIIFKSGYKHEIWQKASLCDTFPKSIMSQFKFQNGHHCQDRKKQNGYQIQNGCLIYIIWTSVIFFVYCFKNVASNFKNNVPINNTCYCVLLPGMLFVSRCV